MNLKHAFNRVAGNLLPVSSRINEIYGRGGAINIVDMLWCVLRYGAHPKDYFMFEFYKKNGWERNSYLTIMRYLRLVKLFDKEVFERLSDKVYQHQKYHDFVRRDWLVLRKGVSRNEVIEFIENHGEVIVKPVCGEQGRGIGKLRKGESKEIDELLQEAQSHDYLLEEVVGNAKELERLNPFSLNTIRVYTLIDKTGNAIVLEVMLRVGRGKKSVDNWGAGGIGYHVDKETGVIDQYGMDKQSNRNMYHPGSNVLMLGFQIPRYQELLAFVGKLASVESKARFVGWDIAVLPDRFELIEMNFPGGHDFLQAFGKGYYRVIKSNW